MLLQKTPLRTRLLKQRRFRQLLIVSVLLSLAFGVIIVPLENVAPHATIHTFGDGLWWSIQTLTTVGYGDVTPVTGPGRFLGVAMQILGAVVFGTLVAIISSSMSRRQEEFYWDRLFERVDQLNERLTKIEQEVQFLVREDTKSEKKED